MPTPLIFIITYFILINSLGRCGHNGLEADELEDKLLVNWPPTLHPSLSQEFWDHADVNDLIAAFTRFLPRDFVLEMNGCADGLCFAPFFCAHTWLGCSHDKLQDLLDPDGVSLWIFLGCISAENC